MIVPQTLKNKIPIVTQEMDYITRIKTVVFFNTTLFLIVWSFWGNTITRDMGYSHLSTANKIISSSIIIPIVPAMDGPVVGKLNPESIPAKAGLRQGDVIVGVNGVMVTSPEMANYLIQSGLQSKTIKLRILRNLQHVNISFQTDNTIKHKTLKVLSLPSSQQFIIMLVFLKLSIIMFFFVFKNIINRMIIVLTFAALMVILGMVMKIYTPLDAFFSIKFNTISLLLGMGIISITLDESGVFDYIALKVTEYGGGSYLKILILCCVLTYILSLLVNNLTTILVIVPMTLNLALMNNIDPKPIIIGEIISSNLGGASTMVGDFPNMLISSETDVMFNEFILNMMPICLILLSVLLLFLHKLSRQRQTHMKFPDTIKNIKNFSTFTRKERRAVKRSVFVLFHVILLFSLSGKLSLNPSAIALLGAMSLFLFSGIKREKIIQRIGFNDILFFVGLFIVVGGLEASGIIHYASEFIKRISFSNKYASCLIIMWISAFVTSFLSAGPTTALLFPIAISIQPLSGGHLIWWSLSLGVLAGSSATLIGATAGPVAATLLEKFSTMYGVTFNGDNTIRYKEFLQIGLPMMGAFLGISSLYIIWLCSRV